jgi:hypothetical protein
MNKTDAVGECKSSVVQKIMIKKKSLITVINEVSYMVMKKPHIPNPATLFIAISPPIPVIT